MQAILILKSEHGLIRKELQNLDRARKRLSIGERPPASIFEHAVAFAHDFADRFHHHKEEFVMFGLLAQKKNGHLDTEIGALRYQHARCRESMSAIEGALKGYAIADEIAVSTVLIHLSVYTALLERHIHIEDHVFFPMCETVLTEKDDRSLISCFAEEEEAMGGRSLTEHWWDRVAAIGAQLDQ